MKRWVREGKQPIRNRPRLGENAEGLKCGKPKYDREEQKVCLSDGNVRETGGEGRGRGLVKEGGNFLVRVDQKGHLLSTEID